MGQLGYAREAEGHLRRALTIDPGMHEGWYNLADVLDELGHAEQAIACLKKCLKIAPSYADAHFNIASLYQRLDRLHEARRHWERYLKMDSTGEWADIAKLNLRMTRD